MKFKDFVYNNFNYFIEILKLRTLDLKKIFSTTMTFLNTLWAIYLRYLKLSNYTSFVSVIN